MPLLVTTDIKLVDPSTEQVQFNRKAFLKTSTTNLLLQGTDVEWRYTEDGERVRIYTVAQFHIVLLACFIFDDVIEQVIL